MSNYVLEEGKRLVERRKELGDLDMQLRGSLDLRGAINKTDTGHRGEALMRFLLHSAPWKVLPIWRS